MGLSIGLLVYILLFEKKKNDYPQLLLNATYWHSPFQNVKNEKLYGFYGTPRHLSIILIKKLSHI